MERLYGVGLRHKQTGERLDIEVWAETPEQATYKLCGSLIGFDTQYTWTGTGPVMKDDHTVER